MSSDPLELLRVLDPARTASAPPITRLNLRLQDDDTVTVVGRQPRRHWGSTALAAVLVGVALAVGIGAVALLHSGATNTPRSPATRTLPPLSRGLVGLLGVLRRPQTAADRNLGSSTQAALSRRSAVGVPVLSLARVAGVTPAGDRIALVPMRPRNGTWPAQPGGSPTGLRLGVFAGGASCCVTAAAIERGSAWESAGSSAGNYVVIVVPDGVTRVRVAFHSPITASVHDNVAAFSVPDAVENLGIYPMTWYGSSGEVIKRFPSSLAPPPTASQARADRARLLRADRQANVHTSPEIRRHFALFGTPPPPSGVLTDGSIRFRITHPALTQLPTSLLSTGSEGNTMDVNNARLLTTTSGLRLWLLSGRVICVYPNAPQGAACSADPGSTLRVGLAIRLPQPNGRLVVVAVVPTTNHTITLTTRSGPRTVAVIDGVGLAPAAGVTGVTYRSSIGARVSQLL